MADSFFPLNQLVQQRMIRPPQLTPKTKYGQHTLGVPPSDPVAYRRLQSVYRREPATLQPLIHGLRGRMKKNEEIPTVPEGIYSWILKRGSFYVTRLLSDQEIGSLHTNLNTLTLHEENRSAFDRNTLKNTRGSDAKPVMAGELLVTERGGRPFLFFNLQSGTFTSPMMKCRIREKSAVHGWNRKQTKEHAPAMEVECRDEMVGEVMDQWIRRTGIEADQIRFLGCDAETDQMLREVPYLRSFYDHGECKEEDDYMERMAGKNLIRRFRVQDTSLENRERFHQYFQTENESVLGKRSFPVSTAVSAPASSRPTTYRKTMKGVRVITNNHVKAGGRKTGHRKTGRKTGRKTCGKKHRR
jgi:hypothetical protein